MVMAQADSGRSEPFVRAMARLAPKRLLFPRAALEATKEVRHVLGFTVVADLSKDGYYVADDPPAHHAYGVGDTAAEAFADWVVALRETFELLVASEDSLAPYLTQELGILRQMLAEPHYELDSA